MNKSSEILNIIFLGASVAKTFWPKIPTRWPNITTILEKKAYFYTIFLNGFRFRTIFDYFNDLKKNPHRKLKITTIWKNWKNPHRRLKITTMVINSHFWQHCLEPCKLASTRRWANLMNVIVISCDVITGKYCLTLQYGHRSNSFTLPVEQSPGHHQMVLFWFDLRNIRSQILGQFNK